MLNVIRNTAAGIWYSFVPGGFHLIVSGTREEAAVNYLLPSGIMVIPYLLLMVSVPLLSVYFWKKEKNLVALGFAAGFITLFPVTGVIPIGVVFAIRFILIPSFFFMIVPGVLAEMFAGKVVLRLGKNDVTISHIVIAVIIVIYCAFTFVISPIWKSDVTLMDYVIEKRPDASLAYFLRGNGLAGEGNANDAIKNYENAIKLRPNYTEAAFNMAIMLERQGRLRDAEKSYRKVLAMNPEYFPARSALIRLLERTGRKQEAMRLIQEGQKLMVDPNDFFFKQSGSRIDRINHKYT